MARITMISLVDDLDGKDADETMTFALDGIDYEIDLSGSNAAALRESNDQNLVCHERRRCDV